MPVVAPQTTRTVPDGMLAVEVAAHEDVQPGARSTTGLLGELERDALGRDDIVAADDALVFDAENVLERHATGGTNAEAGSAGARPNSALKAVRNCSRR